MILIADSGSTKTDWALTDPAKGIQKIIPTVGFNPYFIDSAGIFDELSKTLLTETDASTVSGIFYYGAGCSTPEKKAIVHAALLKAFPAAATIFVGHDLLASCRALLGKSSGFGAILGTGANTCLYDGDSCYLNIDSLGYLLGDEGSASYIGRRFLRDYMRKLLPPQLQTRFGERFSLINNEEVLRTLYSHAFPNRYLAGFCAFADEFESDPYVRGIVKEAFADFFKNLVSRYPSYTDYSFNCVGSVAFVFKPLLEEVAADYGMKMGKVIRSPLNDLVKFHLDNVL